MPAPAAGYVYRFDSFEVHPHSKRLLNAGQALSITAKAFDTLVVLVENAGRTVTKDELLREVWSDAVVEEANLTQQIFLLRKLLGEAPREHRFIATVPRQGYRFVAPVVVSADGAAPSAPTRSPGSLRLSLPLCAPLDLGASTPFTLSPDGRLIAYVAGKASETTLRVQRLDGTDTRVIPNSGGASTPCFSPDSRWVAFVARGALHRAYVAGGTPTVICEAGSDCRGLSWSVRGEIVFAPTPASGLLAVPADGGRPLEITRLDFRSGERTHRWPHVLPDGNQVLFTVARAGSASFDEADIWLLHRDTGERRVVQGFGTAAQFASSGHLMYVRGGSLMTVPFAPDQGQVSGTPIPAVTGLMPLPTGAGLFAHSDSGLIMYLTGDAQDTGQCLAWLTGDGSLDSLDVPGAAFDEPRLSSDGLRIAVGVRSGKSDIWIRDCQHGGLRRFTFTGDNFAPIWTRDNRSIIFSSNRHGPCSLYLKGLDDAEPVRLVSSDFDLVPGSLSRDGRVVLFTEYHPETGADLYSYRMGTDEGPRPILRTRANEFCPTLAPDGRGLAFVSDQSGRHEVYLMPFPEGEPVTPVTTSGGSEPVWHPDGRRLYYRVGSAICAMDVDGVTPVRGSEAVVGDGPFRAGSPTGIANYDVSQDGRLLVVKQTTAHARPTELSVIVNWSPADLR